LRTAFKPSATAAAPGPTKHTQSELPGATPGLTPSPVTLVALANTWRARRALRRLALDVPLIVE
jgi:hypothetical protein